MPISWLVYWMTNVHDRSLKYHELSGYEGWWREECQRSAITNALPPEVCCLYSTSHASIMIGESIASRCEAPTVPTFKADLDIFYCGSSSVSFAFTGPVGRAHHTSSSSRMPTKCLLPVCSFRFGATRRACTTTSTPTGKGTGTLRWIC